MSAVRTEMVKPSQHVVCAAPHPAALEAAEQIVAAGGGAVDAAVAGAAALAVVYPHQCSIGGDLIAIVRPAGPQPARVVLSAGAAPQDINPAALQDAGERMPPGGPLTVTVPGAVAGMAALTERWGRLPFSTLFGPATRIARNGTRASAGLTRAIRRHSRTIQADPGLSEILRPDGRDLESGEIVRQPALAETMEGIAAEPSSFYRGALAHHLAASLARRGSPMSVDDLAAHNAEVVAPLSVEAGGAIWSVAPPPSQGAALLAALVGALGSTAGLVRSARAAELRRDACLGDPRAGSVDTEALMGGGPPPKQQQSAPKPAGDTVAVSAVDGDGTAVSLIMSVFQCFGSGFLDPETGVLFHNRGSAFSLDPGHPGTLTPGARPPHTLCPVVIEHGTTTVALGCQGGRAQPWILAQLASDVLREDDLTALLARPRWVIGGRDLGLDSPGIGIEPGAPSEVVPAAVELGLEVRHWSGPEDEAGHVQVARSKGGRLDGASDPRADGRAAILCMGSKRDEVASKSRP